MHVGIGHRSLVIRDLHSEFFHLLLYVVGRHIPNNRYRCTWALIRSQVHSSCRRKNPGRPCSLHQRENSVLELLDTFFLTLGAVSFSFQWFFRCFKRDSFCITACRSQNVVLMENKAYYLFQFRVRYGFVCDTYCMFPCTFVPASIQFLQFRHCIARGSVGAPFVGHNVSLPWRFDWHQCRLSVRGSFVDATFKKWYI